MSKRNLTEAIRNEIRRINGIRRKVYPDIGYLQFADIRGSGVPLRRVYVITNANGGVSVSDLNASPADDFAATLEKLKAVQA